MSRDLAAALERARAVLAGADLGEAAVASAGPEDEILAVAAAPALLPRVRALAPALKEAGFRYVALELASPTTPPQTPEA